MAKLKKLYMIESILSGILGIILLVSTKMSVIGNAIGIKDIPANSSIAWGLFFLIGGIILFVLTKYQE